MADLQSTNRVALAKVRESSFGVTPANPAFKAVRSTSSGLAASPTTVTTNELRSDRQITDLILVGQQAQGDIGAELSFRSHDDDIEEALQGTWANNPYIEVLNSDTEISDVSATTLTVASGGAAFKTGMLALLEGFSTSANNKLARVSSSTGTTIVFPSSTFTVQGTVNVGAKIRVVGFQGASGDLTAVTVGGNGLGSTALDFTTLGLSVGDWIKIGSAVTDTSFSGTVANNGWARISGIAATKLSLDMVPAGWTADTGTGKTIVVFTGDHVRNGTTKRSNTFERQYLDHSPVTYELLRGMVLNTLNISLGTQQIVTMTKSYMGRDGVVSNSRTSGATDVAAPTNDVLNTSTNIGDLSFDGSVVTGPNFIMEASIEITNNLRMQNAVGSIGAVGIGNGEFSVTGNLNTYFGDKSVLEKVLNNNRTSLSLRAGRQDGNKETILFDMPTIKLATGSPGVAGKNQDVMIGATYQAIMHATLGYTMNIQRFWYLG